MEIMNDMNDMCDAAWPRSVTALPNVDMDV